MARQLTDKQMHTLRFIYDYIKNNDCAPATKEIGEALGITLTVVYDRTASLFGHGYLIKPKMERHNRNLALTEKGILACEGDE
jgi:Mn-dependent DtxR family transcriptional regulator